MNAFPKLIAVFGMKKVCEMQEIQYRLNRGHSRHSYGLDAQLVTIYHNGIEKIRLVPQCINKGSRLEKFLPW